MPDSAPLLTVTHLKKSYYTPDGDPLPIIDVPEFHVSSGDQIAVHGRSGSGKTTFLHLIAGILQADSGQIFLDGQEITALSEPERDVVRARSTGYIFQAFNLLDGFTALENVELAMMFGQGIDRQRARYLLETVGLADRLHYRPSQLSAGQQQRVAVARALANQPQLVLADEPTGNLDVHHAQEALNLIRRVCAEQGAALLLVSHDPAMLAQFDHVIPFETINRVLA
ncbi:MAG: ABC transporter ATP-binding protein [Gemmatimonadetes bacterium]|nr:MAG: ABC transporter ATP-binding protein [Gemmatimonadota bacterium]